MNENDLRVFIDAVSHYFSQMTGRPGKVQTPYLHEDADVLAHEFTGIIGISGRKKGVVYFTTPPGLLSHLLLLLEESDKTDSLMCDLVGEIANTIAGNARQYFGPDFMISVPVVVQGQPERIRVPENCRSFVIPVNWQNHESAVIVGIQ
ncbi:MAG: chemotaxis protein CheX [Pseudomonadota bacterium]